MDSSPLTKAHDHARAAAVATRQASDTTEHLQRRGAEDPEASRGAPQEAGRNLEAAPEQTSQGSDGDINEKQPSEKDDAGADSKKDSMDTTVKAGPPGLTQQRRYATREMSSSIASNLASARGIRSKYRGQPLSPSVSNDQAPGNVEPHLRRDGSKVKMQNIMENQSGRPAWVPPMSKQDGLGKSAAPLKTEPASPPKDDGGYTRFYNTFGSLINKISAPLAFAGLPLIQEEPTTPIEADETPNVSPTKPTRIRISPTPTMEPDLSKIYSRATLRALAREGHVATDSFYVVPSTGHTMSYANILTYAEKEKRRLEASAHGDLGISINEDDDDFVDARESPVPLSPGARRRIGRAHSDRDLHNIIEELSLENKSLKDMMDKLTKRLHTFEASAQSMALAESYRIMRPGSPLSAGGGKVNDDVIKKNHELEEQLAAIMKQMERLEKDNRKMQKTLEKYREKWETLKAGAKARREAQVTAESIEDARSSIS
ncbi:hypothetical protein PT974_00708 [Cladobotryum mycophilum]|uniref:Uncharacterized protein n=1 Tax=Cladobotryum mycophilum TaxID=491253 RepID=A0ABR0T281_9HYPO